MTYPRPRLAALAVRRVCTRCRRPEVVCYCAALPTLDTVTRVVILQHPRERDMPIGTARMASLCLPQARLHVGMRWDERSALHDALRDPARPPILLYPGPGARDILREPPSGPVTLVVVDGTWSQAKTVVRDNPALGALPRYAFTTPEPTHYRIRREPRAEYVSTIEALMHVLGVLEGDPARFRALLDPLNAMIDAHLAQHGRGLSPRVRRRGRMPRPLRDRLPATITDRFDDLVCVVGEANVWPYRVEKQGTGDLVHWVAYRPGTGELFDVVAAPERMLTPGTPLHIELDADRLLAGAPRASLHAAFGRFLRATDVICSWGTFGPELYRASGGRLPDDWLDLRAVAQRLTTGKVGPLEDYAARTVAPPSSPLAAGRAGRRLAMLADIVRAWRAFPPSNDRPLDCV